MIQLSYVSSAAQLMTAADLLLILQQCYRHNPLQDVTGLLLYGNGTFLQALEGDEDVVSPLYEKIARDPRHARVTCLSRKTIETRHFPGWSMGFRRLSDDFNSGTATSDGARDALLRHFAGPQPEMHGSPRDAVCDVAELRAALRRAQGGIEIARLVLEDIAEAHAEGRFGDTQGKLCRFALGQINGV